MSDDNRSEVDCRSSCGKDITLKSISSFPGIFICRQAVDGRKQINTLAALVESDLGQRPFEGSLFVFINRRRDIGEAPTEERFLVRQKISKPILDEMRRWLDKNFAEVLPKSLTGKALGYLNNEWENLARHIDSGDLSIDNNLAERAIKPFAVGRKKWLFSDTPAGAAASAALYSLIESAKANKVEPYAYLKHVFTGIPK